MNLFVPSPSLAFLGSLATLIFVPSLSHHLHSWLVSAALLPCLMSCKKGATQIMHRAPPGTSVPLRQPGYLPARPKNLSSLLVLLLVVLLPHEVHGPAAPGVGLRGAPDDVALPPDSSISSLPRLTLPSGLARFCTAVSATRLPPPGSMQTSSPLPAAPPLEIPPSRQLHDPLRTMLLPLKKFHLHIVNDQLHRSWLPPLKPLLLRPTPVPLLIDLVELSPCKLHCRVVLANSQLYPQSLHAALTVHLATTAAPIAMKRPPNTTVISIVSMPEISATRLAPIAIMILP